MANAGFEMNIRYESPASGKIERTLEKAVAKLWFYLAVPTVKLNINQLIRSII